MLLRRSEVLVLILLYCNSAPIGCFRWNVISSRARCFSGFRSWRRSVERGCGDEEVEVVFVDADEADTLREQSGRIEKPEVTYSVNDDYQIEQTRLATLVKEWENQKGTDDGMGSDELAAEAQLDALAAELFAADEGFTQEFLGDTLSSSASPLPEEEPEPYMRGVSVGIDLGTTNSAVAAIVDGTPTILRVPVKNKKQSEASTIASAVAFRPEGIVAVGSEALSLEGESCITDRIPQTRIFTSVKRVIGRTLSEAREAGEDLSLLHVASTGSRIKYYQERRKEILETAKSNNVGGSMEDTQHLVRTLQEKEASGAVLLQSNAINDDGSEGVITPEAVSAEIVRHLLRCAEMALQTEFSVRANSCGEGDSFIESRGAQTQHTLLPHPLQQRLGTPSSVTRAVITVPAYFGAAQCDATREAGRLAGLERVALLKEPEAAALAYGLGKEEDELVLVFDLGGGTLDVSVLEVGGGVIEVIATSGDNHLGGDDFDAALADYLGSEALKILLSHEAHEIPSDLLPGRPRQAWTLETRRYLRVVAEDVKKRLSTRTSVDVNLDQMKLHLVHRRPEAGIQQNDIPNNAPPIRLIVSRQQFASLCEPLLQRIMKPLREVALMASILLPGDVGSAAIPLMNEASPITEPQPIKSIEEEITTSPIAMIDQQGLSALKKKQKKAREKARERQKQGKRERAETMAAQRAFLEGQSRSSNKSNHGKSTNNDIIGKKKGGLDSRGKMRPFPVGRVVDKLILVGGATRMPVVRALLRVTFGIEPQRTVDPDEAVALGAAIHAGMMDGDGALASLDVLNPFQASVLRYLHKKQQQDERGTGGGRVK